MSQAHIYIYICMYVCMYVSMYVMYAERERERYIYIYIYNTAFNRLSSKVLQLSGLRRRGFREGFGETPWLVGFVI